MISTSVCADSSRWKTGPVYIVTSGPRAYVRRIIAIPFNQWDGLVGSRGIGCI